MIDTTREELLTVLEAAEMLKRNPKTVGRWFDERRTKYLESTMIGGTRYTSREAIQRFSVQGRRARSAPQIASGTHDERVSAALDVLRGLGLKV